MRASDPPSPGRQQTIAQPQGNTSEHQASTNGNDQNATLLPPAVQTMPTTAQQIVPPEEPEQARDYTSSEWWLVYLTGALAVITFSLAVYTGKLWRATVNLARDAKATSDAQDKNIKESLREAANQTSAMLSVAKATTDNATLMKGILHKQMRAYIAVNVGTGTFQDETNRFGSAPVLENTGFTPARNVSFHMQADVLPVELPADFAFELGGNRVVNDAGLAPRQTMHVVTISNTSFPDDEIDNIMRGIGRLLYVWGTVWYDDVYGGSWQTNFCHHFFFTGVRDAPKSVEVRGFYFHRHNDAT